MQQALIVQQPASAAQQLVLLFHGVGATARDLLPLAQGVARAFAQAWVVSVQAPHASDFGTGSQWFSVRGVDEANRIGRVAEAMPRFVQTVRDWQREAGLGVDATSLVGFSQGAIMALESTQQPEALAGRVVAIAGRFAQPPGVAPRETLLHLIHGQQDAVIHPGHSVDAAGRLEVLGARVTVDMIPGLGHGIDGRVLERVIERMQAQPRPTT